VDLDRNLFYVDHLSSLTFDLLQNLLGGRCKSVAHQTASDLPAREAHQIPEGRDHFSLVQVCTQLGGGAGTAAFPTCGTNTACFGGFNGGGSSRFGGGGGASGVRTVSRAQDGSLASRLIVAAGGGSAGEALCGDSGPFLQGGTGGDAGSDGGSGQPCGSLAGGTGGKAGTQSEGGAGGSPGGLSGSLGQGGSGNFVSGGGGGGGGGNLTSGDGVRAPGGGGGAGSNLVPTGGTASIATTTGPSIIISYTVPKPAPTTKEQCKKGGWKNFSFPDQGTCITFVNENRR
jgi:hypothetical protein